MFLLTLGKFKRSHELCLCRIKRMGRRTERHSPSRRWKLIHVERCVLASPTWWEQLGCTQGPELQGGLSLLFIHGFSYPTREGPQYVRKSTVCVQPPFLQISAYICSWCLCWAHMFSQLWRAMPCNSSPSCAPVGMQWFSTWVWPQIPKWPLLRSSVLCGLFQGDRTGILYIPFYIHNSSRNTLFPPYSDTIISCFLGMRSQNYSHYYSPTELLHKNHGVMWQKDPIGIIKRN